MQTFLLYFFAVSQFSPCYQPLYFALPKWKVIMLFEALFVLFLVATIHTEPKFQFWFMNSILPYVKLVERMNFSFFCAEIQKMNFWVKIGLLRQCVARVVAWQVRPRPQLLYHRAKILFFTILNAFTCEPFSLSCPGIPEGDFSLHLHCAVTAETEVLYQKEGTQYFSNFKYIRPLFIITQKSFFLCLPSKISDLFKYLEH